jgi:hypothetical protein
MAVGGTEVRWFGVRCVFAIGGPLQADGVLTYEERVTIWRATSQDKAIELAEAEALKYAHQDEQHPDAYLGLAQCYELADTIGEGAEVFSLMRDSRLAPAGYLSAFFDTGAERQETSGLPE